MSPHPMVITTSEASTASVVRIFGSFGGNVDTFFGHGLDGDGIDLVGGFGTGRAYHDLAAGQLTEIAGGHLVNAGILTREQRGKWAYYRLVPGALDVLAALITSPE